MSYDCLKGISILIIPKYVNSFALRIDTMSSRTDVRISCYVKFCCLSEPFPGIFLLMVG